jgi:hypothetical protein
MRKYMLTDPMLMSDIWGVVMGAIYSVVSYKLVRRRLHNRGLRRMVKDMRALRRKPSPQWVPNSETRRGIIIAPFSQSGGQIGNYWTNVALEEGHFGVQVDRQSGLLVERTS